MERQHPSQVLSNMRRDLRAGKVLIDWSQNHGAKTTIAPYSLRALPAPTVSTPLTWPEVERGAGGGGGEQLRFLASRCPGEDRVPGRPVRAPDRRRRDPGASSGKARARHKPKTKA